MQLFKVFYLSLIGLVMGVIGSTFVYALRDTSILASPWWSVFVHGVAFTLPGVITAYTMILMNNKYICFLKSILFCGAVGGFLFGVSVAFGFYIVVPFHFAFFLGLGAKEAKVALMACIVSMAVNLIMAVVMVKLRDSGVLTPELMFEERFLMQVLMIFSINIGALIPLRLGEEPSYFANQGRSVV